MGQHIAGFSVAVTRNDPYIRPRFQKAQSKSWKNTIYDQEIEIVTKYKYLEQYLITNLDGMITLNQNMLAASVFS